MGDASELWSDLLPKAAKIPILVYKYRAAIGATVKSGLLKIGLGKTQVVVMGRAAVGKSVILARLTSSSDNFDWNLPPTSNGPEAAVLRLKHSSMIVRALPGQDDASKYKAMGEAFYKHKGLKGAIYVCDWGYTKVRSKAVSAEMVASGVTGIAERRAIALTEELRDFERFCEKIKESYSRCGTPQWLLVIVNKCDLFHHKIDDAQRYYDKDGDSVFADLIKELVNYIGAGNIFVESFPMSCWHENFNWNGDIAQSQLDDTEAGGLFRYMKQKLEEFA